MVSKNVYKEDYEAEKDMVYYPADWNPGILQLFKTVNLPKNILGYQQQQAQKNSENEYKKKYEKTKAENKFNACETITYNDQKKKKVIPTTV